MRMARVPFTSSGVNVRPRGVCTPSTSKKSSLTRTPVMRSGSPAPVRLNRSERIQASRSNVVFRVRKSVTSPGEAGSVSKPTRCWTSALYSQGITSRSDLGYGKGRRRTLSMMLKIAALPPMPSASVAIAIAVNPGRRARARMAARMSCMGLMVGPNERQARTKSIARRTWGQVLQFAFCVSARPDPGVC